MVFERGGAFALPVAVIDGPFDLNAMAGVLAQTPTSLAKSSCVLSSDSVCNHGTFIMGILGARKEALIPGLCPSCRLIHIPLFLGDDVPWASVADLSDALDLAVAAGAKLINLSLAIQGDDSQYYPDLAASLSDAEASGAIVVAAAGNQGRWTVGQLLSHPVTVPVVAMDATGRLLPDCNFGPSIVRRGVAAFGHEVLGFAAGGRMIAMSGTSVATAIATGTLAQIWSARPNMKGADLRAGIAHLAPRNGLTPPMLDRDVLLAALDQADASLSAAPLTRFAKAGCLMLQGGAAMTVGNEPLGAANPSSSTATSGHAVTPAHSLGGCTCGAPGGLCTCNGQSSSSSFIYVLGTVDVRFPDQSISEELQTVARGLVAEGRETEMRPDESLRSWYARILKHPEARYVARQLCWILKVEGQFGYYLSLRDLHELPDLISCLSRPEPQDQCLHEDLDLVVGSSSLVAVNLCPGVTAPILEVDQLCSFKRDDLIAWFKVSAKPSSRKRRIGADNSDEHDPFEFYKELVQCADNFGHTNRWRALNYLAVRYQPLYELYVQKMGEGYTFSGVELITSRLWREQHILDPVFAFQNTSTGVVQKYFVRVDVSHLFPMLITHLGKYFDR